MPGSVQPKHNAPVRSASLNSGIIIVVTPDMWRNYSSLRFSHNLRATKIATNRIVSRFSDSVLDSGFTTSLGPG